ncbi:cutinase family protein [Flavimobilis sp. GY10621]|uniref:Cutinase family protein n=1 Tax=Flavimobilis rhizosphaerae TaxID=2775421 RepID=A0ABR9DTC3_9MICO|nr:cutinase family protein [Flavimobilis rhizosphaerae]MBD9700383.1 cutinase family protein [Flavimobilis rhizosphaerae]
MAPANAKAEVVQDSSLSKEVITKSCKAQVAVIGARGSGEGQSAGTIPGFGTRVSPVAQSIRSKMANGTKIRYLSAIYPAVEASNAVTAPKVYQNSVNYGVSSVKSMVTKLVDNCPKTRIVLAGYSQGAQVMHGVARQLTGKYQKAISSIILIANPVNNMSDPLMLSFTGGEKLAKPQTWRGVLARGANLPSAYGIRVLSVCAPKDVVCNAKPIDLFAGPIVASFKLSVHVNSYQKSTFYDYPAKFANAAIVRDGVK